MFDLSEFIKANALSEDYKYSVKQWFIPFSKKIHAMASLQSRPLVLGINGAQGSGKSTLADLLVYLFNHRYNWPAIALSLDDFYLTRQQRLDLSKNVHPLLKTRGVPGTHDIKLAQQTIQKLTEHCSTEIPRFNKAEDDRFPKQDWAFIEKPVKLIVLEGWCLGAEPQSDSALQVCVNDLERQEDPRCIWRRFVNQHLQTDYAHFFSLVDYWAMLKAPSFASVHGWRLEQEQKLYLKSKANHRLMDEKKIARFIKHYQRITEHGLVSLPTRMDKVFELDDKRLISRCITKQ